MRVGWPALESLLRDHTALASEFLKVYLFIEILNTRARGGDRAGDYLLNSFDGVAVEDDEVVITGSCYRVDHAPV